MSLDICDRRHKEHESECRPYDDFRFWFCVLFLKWLLYIAPPYRAEGQIILRHIRNMADEMVAYLDARMARRDGGST